MSNEHEPFNFIEKFEICDVEKKNITFILIIYIRYFYICYIINMYYYLQ